jgi:cytochrome P450
MDDPLSVLLPCYERYGEVFSVRVFHERVVFMLGPAANHFILVTGAANFIWRDSDYSQLIPLIGDGLLTTDGGYHDRVRRLLLPAFHHDSIARAVEAMLEEAEQALDRLPATGSRLDIYAWARRLAMRIAMRALLGLDPDDRDNGSRAAVLFEQALSYYGTSPLARTQRGPGSWWRRMQAARADLELILDAEIGRRRGQTTAESADVLGMLLAVRDEDGRGLSDQEVRHQLMTLAFAGHDTATSTITFLLYELARHPDALERIWREQDERLTGRVGAEQLGGQLAELEMALDETLRLYPPAWIGPRRVVRGFEFGRWQIPAGAYAAYSSWATHRLPDVFPEPDAFRPERFAPEARAALPKGAYVPFGGGSRTCIGMRFGQTEVRAVATALLRRFRPELPAGYRMRVRQMPTLGPAGGLPLTLQPR